MNTVTYPGTPYQTDRSEPLLGFRFSVFFFMHGDQPNSLDIRFSKVSGISGRIDTQPLNEGGQNLFSHRLPTRAVVVQDRTLNAGDENLARTATPEVRQVLFRSAVHPLPGCPIVV